ncbi:hypothetical protein [Ruminococcus sp. HUN007]|uniref:hypothetical protein n=1 Tax=Ruminococcus sp. HUN007 TaxID=1514668 RepID=UPI000A873985|nr:hypothetical protein [Ruminococcus sp. HUN007]
MGMVVRTNMAAINANNSLANASKAQQSGHAENSRPALESTQLRMMLQVSLLQRR